MALRRIQAPLLLLHSLALSVCLAAAAASYYEDKSPGLPQQFLYLHNIARAQVGVPALQWSPQLARYAEWWAEQRAVQGDCHLQHSGGPYGENIFWGGGGVKHWVAIDAVSDWVKERQSYLHSSNTCAQHASCEHYTQVVWRSSRFVGCARVTCASDGNIFMTCNYFPPGNVFGQRPY